MLFTFSDSKEIVLKAKRKRPRWSEVRNGKRLEALSARMGSAVKVDIVNGINTFKKRVDPDVLYDAFIKGDFAAVNATIPWDKLDEDLEPAKARLFQSLKTIGGIGIDVIAKPERKLLRYDYENPRIKRILNTRSGEWITNIRQQSREAIREITRRHMVEHLSPRQIAIRIKQTGIGLYPRLANAHDNYVRGLVASGLPEKRVEALGQQYYNKLLDYRANGIARTETQFMINRGQLEVWKQGQDQGLLPPEATKVWVVDGNPCPECIEMDGEEVGLNEQWLTEDGPVDVPTEIHPSCQCIMTINIDGKEE